MMFLKRLFCKHREETETSFLNTDGEVCCMAFCCQCGVLRYFEKFYKDHPQIQQDRIGVCGGTPMKSIAQYAKPGYNHNPVVFHENEKQEKWESGFFSRRTDGDKPSTG